MLQTNTRRLIGQPYIAQLFGALILIILVGFWRSQQHYPIYDIYPLYYGAQAFWETDNAYNLDAAIDYRDVLVIEGASGEVLYPYEQMQKIGNAYPLPAVVLFTPWSYLPHPWASITWMVFLVMLAVIGLTLLRAPWWWLGYWPAIDALRLEQYTFFIFCMQLLAIAAWERRHDWKSAPWVLATTTMLMLTKPTHGFFVALLLLFISRTWKPARIPCVVMFLAIWVLPTLIDPNWVWEWFKAQQAYTLEKSIIPWPLLLLVLPFLRTRNWLGAATITQLALAPYTLIYPFISMSLSVLRHRLSWLLVLISNFWLVVSIRLNFGKIVPEDIAAGVIVCILPVIFVQYQRSIENQAALIKLDSL